MLHVASKMVSTRSMIKSKNTFFDMFDIPKQGALYDESSKFNFEEFVRDYNSIHVANTDIEKTFSGILIKMLTAHGLVIRISDVDVDMMLLLLGIFLMTYSTPGRIVCLCKPAFHHAVRVKHGLLLTVADKYRPIIQYLPALDDTYYEYVLNCWDKVREGDGVFSEFDECVVDSSNMMSEVLQFV
jgi:hypothetical protein